LWRRYSAFDANSLLSRTGNYFGGTGNFGGRTGSLSPEIEIISGRDFRNKEPLEDVRFTPENRTLLALLGISSAAK
jgi:hypothetical protein